MSALKSVYVTYLFLATAAPLALSSGMDFKSVHVGQNVTLKCFYQASNGVIFYWYKKPKGKKAQLMSEFYKHRQNGSLNHDLTTNDQRFELETGNSKFHLTISNVQISDSATYYCVGLFSYSFKFLDGITVHVKGSGLNIEAVVPLSELENTQSRSSATINCSLQTGIYDGEHSFYWFEDFEGSFLKLIYTHESRSNMHEKKANTEMCVYNLPLNGFDVSHTVNYYCAVASCGQILLGKTTNQDQRYDSVTLFWTGICAFTITLSLLLALSVCTISKKMSFTSSEPQPRDQSADKKLAENISYTAFVIVTNRSIRQKDPIWSECVYYTAE